MFRLVPPAGTGLTIGDLARIKVKWISRASSSPTFDNELRELFGAKHVLPVDSGRAALYLILKTIEKQRGDSRREVILPAYTCYSVAASVIRAGFMIRLVDVKPETMDYDFDSLAAQDVSNVAAIVVGSLFGIPNDWRRLQEFAKQHHIDLIDDAAQALGESSYGTACGLHGTVGFYSLGRGKNISTYSGGIIVTNDEAFASDLKAAIDLLPKPGLIASIGSLYKMGFFSLLSRPGLFWLPAMLPFLGIGETVYEESFSVGRLTNAQTSAIPVVMKKLANLRQTRIGNSMAMAKSIHGARGRFVPGFSGDSCPAYIRMPILMPDETSRSACIQSLRAKGIVASTMYPTTIGKITQLPQGSICNPGEFSGAEDIIRRLMTVPTHPYVSKRDREVIIESVLS
ncbi:MAG: DegT/DnrJ/EryC1/StrS family aminotransferase [Candidatus Zixiibacteriota bacterium]